jgi:predicted PurR-regulated permease PerM
VAEQPLLLDTRERRWLLAFLILGTAFFTLVVGEFVLRLLGAFSGVLLVLFLSWLLAFLMSPVVDFLTPRLRLPRGVVVVLSYLVVLVALGFGLFYTGTAITQQVADLSENFPQTAAQIRDTLAQWQEGLRIGRLQINLVQLFESLQEQAGVIAGAIFAQAQLIAGVTVAALAALALIIVLSMYMVLDSARLLAKAHRLTPRRYRDELAMFERSVARAFGGFIRAQVVLGIIQALIVAATWIVLGFFFDLPYVFLVSSLAGIAMLIPFFGPAIAFVPPLATAAIYEPEAVVWVFAILFVAQLPMVNWLQPRLMQNALGMHPILVLLGLVVGAQVAGVWGALFGIPAVAVVNVFVNYFAERAVPNVLLPERERLDYVQEMTLVKVEKGQVADETHPSIHVHRSLRPDGSEQFELEVPSEEEGTQAPPRRREDEAPGSAR